MKKLFFFLALSLSLSSVAQQYSGWFVRCRPEEDNISGGKCDRVDSVITVNGNDQFTVVIVGENATYDVPLNTVPGVDAVNDSAYIFAGSQWNQRKSVLGEDYNEQYQNNPQFRKVITDSVFAPEDEFGLYAY